MRGSQILSLTGYCDADCAQDKDTLSIDHQMRVLSWIQSCLMVSKRQSTMSLSTTKAEFRAATMAAQECTWLRQLLK